MFLSMIAHYNIRPVEAQYLWVFQKQLQDFDPQDVVYILSGEYLKQYTPQRRWEMQPKAAAKHHYVPTENVDFEKLNYKLCNNSGIEGFPESVNLRAFMSHAQLALNYVLEKIDLSQIKAGITWVNNATFKHALNQAGIPVIHNEMGPLRSPVYKDTFYFDFEGVNGNTEFVKRFSEFLKVSDKVELLEMPELIDLVVKPEHKDTLFNPHIFGINDIDCGVALQVENDTNLLAFNNGWQISDLLSYAHKKHDSVLIRNHPCAELLSSKGFGDSYAYSYEFLGKVKKLITINSSVAFEALLLGKDVEIKGDSPFACICSLDDDLRRKALNFAIISYLVPIMYLFDKDYYNFRLACKEEAELYRIGLENWRNLK